MKRLVRNPHFFFFIAAAILLFIGLKTPGTESFDINIHDTYIVIAKSHYYFLFSIILMVIGFFYMLVIYQRVHLSAGLIKIHWLTTILIPFSIWILPLFYKKLTGPQRYLWENREFNFYIDVFLMFFIPLCLFLILCLLPVNLIWSLWKAKGTGKD